MTQTSFDSMSHSDIFGTFLRTNFWLAFLYRSHERVISRTLYSYLPGANIGLTTTLSPSWKPLYSGVNRTPLPRFQHSIFLSSGASFVLFPATKTWSSSRRRGYMCHPHPRGTENPAKHSPFH